LNPDSGPTPTNMEATVDAGVLDAGKYQAMIVIVGWPEEVVDRLQGVDVNLFVVDTFVYHPLIMN